MSSTADGEGAAPTPDSGSKGAADEQVVAGYADALFAVAQAEGVLGRVEDELFRFARALDANSDLRDRLTDPSVDVATKLEVVAGLLHGRAHPQTESAVLWLVHAGRARELSRVADAVVAKAAASRNRVVAEIRTAVDLDEDKRQRLTQALEQATGKTIEPKIVVDPDVVGGIVVTVGDTVIDGSVARRLMELRSRLIGA